MSRSGLRRGNLFARELPDGSAPAMSAIARLYQLTRERAGEAELAAQKREARAAYAEILHAIAPLAERDHPAELENAAALRQRWAESVMLWMHFCKTSSSPLLDSLDTATLDVFPVDLSPDADAFARLRRALAQSTGLGYRDLAEAEHNVRHLTSVLPLKLALTAGLVSHLTASGGADAEGRARLMSQVYGPLPWRAGDVDLLLTSTGIFFILPLDGERLDVADWDARPAEEREKIQSFLRRLARENVAETPRFPAFGLLDMDRIDAGLIELLVAATGVRAEVVEKTLVTMVSMLPRSEVDQYLVHDAWGHVWQEVLNEFEWEYALLRSIADPLTVRDGPVYGDPHAPLASAFVADGGTTTLDEARLLASVEADLRGRIQVGLSAVLSEVFADFVEAKYSRLNPRRPLPTSSALDTTSLKFDLTIKDVLRQAERWSRPYRKLVHEADEQARFARELAAAGLPEIGLAAAVANAARAIERHFEPALRTELVASAEGVSTVAGRALLKLALLSRELERVLTDTATYRTSPAWMRPAYCPDLWAVSLSHLYEADRQRRFWCLDWLVRSPLRLWSETLGRALGSWTAHPSANAVDPALSTRTMGAMDRSELFPLFSDVHMSADEATAIAAALRDIAEIDGTHPEEQEMIEGLVHEIGVELGDAPVLPRITPKELATKLVTPELRTAALQAAVLLAMADGIISEPERRRILEYAAALGVSPADYAALEATIAGWVRSGDASPLFS